MIRSETPYYLFQVDHGIHRLVKMAGWLVSDSYLNADDLWDHPRDVKTVSGIFNVTRRSWKDATLPLRVG